MLLHPPSDAWPSFFGDYSARRFSALKEINNANVQDLSLEWATRFTPGPAGTAVSIKSPALLVNGILYFTSPNNGWAADARTGRELWHYGYPPNTGNTNGNRGFGIYGNWLYMETPDGNLVCLNAADGKERWKVRITDQKLDYTTTAAPIVIGNHILIGVGGDHLDNPGFLESVDPETGATQWKTNTDSAQRRTRHRKPGPMNTPPRTPLDKPGFPAPTIPISTFTISAPAIPIR